MSNIPRPHFDLTTDMDMFGSPFTRIRIGWNHLEVSDRIFMADELTDDQASIIEDCLNRVMNDLMDSLSASGG